jgi:hypothetical protein
MRMCSNFAHLAVLTDTVTTLNRNELTDFIRKQCPTLIVYVSSLSDKFFPGLLVSESRDCGDCALANMPSGSGVPTTEFVSQDQLRRADSERIRKKMKLRGDESDEQVAIMARNIHKTLLAGKFD